MDIQKIIMMKRIDKIDWHLLKKLIESTKIKLKGIKHFKEQINQDSLELENFNQFLKIKLYMMRIKIMISNSAQTGKNEFICNYIYKYIK